MGLDALDPWQQVEPPGEAQEAHYAVESTDQPRLKGFISPGSNQIYNIKNDKKEQLTEKENSEAQ